MRRREKSYLFQSFDESNFWADMSDLSFLKFDLQVFDGQIDYFRLTFHGGLFEKKNPKVK